MRILTTFLPVLLLASHCLAAAIPAVLPAPDDTPPAKDKPVKVYIMSGQSNMIGYGTIGPASPNHSSIYLVADPGILPCKMPVGNSALLPHYVFQGAEGDARGAKAFVYTGAYAPGRDFAKEKAAKETVVHLGAASETLPSIDGESTVVLKAFVQMPMTGQHEVYVGDGDSSYAIASINGQEVYRRETGGKAVITRIKLESGKRYPLTITYLKEGPATFWMEVVDLPGKGGLVSLIQDEGLFSFLMDEKGEWTVRNDVMLNESYLDKNKFKGGRSTPLSATANGRHFGPELGFGFVMGTFHDEPVLLIKADIGNRSLGWDCLPPGSKAFEFEGKMIPGYGGTSKDPEGKNGKPKGKAWYAGKQYDEYTKAIHGTLDNFDRLYPQFKDQGYEIAGFVWWQGHKDIGHDAHKANYGKNLAKLIRAWRKEFDAPDAKWVVATVAFEGPSMSEGYQQIAKEQLSVSGESGRFPEFKGNVKTIDARPFWRDRGESPTGKGYHYNHNA